MGRCESCSNSKKSKKCTCKCLLSCDIRCGVAEPILPEFELIQVSGSPGGGLPALPAKIGTIISGTPGNPMALLLTGAGYNAMYWRFLIPSLVSKGYYVVATTLRGYSPTVLDVPGTLPNQGTIYNYFVSDASEVAFLKGIQPTNNNIIIASDWGSVTAQIILSALPGFFKKFVSDAVVPVNMLGQIQREGIPWKFVKGTLYQEWYSISNTRLNTGSSTCDAFAQDPSYESNRPDRNGVNFTREFFNDMLWGKCTSPVVIKYEMDNFCLPSIYNDYNNNRGTVGAPYTALFSIPWGVNIIPSPANVDSLYIIGYQDGTAPWLQVYGPTNVLTRIKDPANSGTGFVDAYFSRKSGHFPQISDTVEVNKRILRFVGNA